MVDPSYRHCSSLVTVASELTEELAQARLEDPRHHQLQQTAWALMAWEQRALVDHRWEQRAAWEQRASADHHHQQQLHWHHPAA
jgi:hypothetical protein